MRNVIYSLSLLAVLNFGCSENLDPSTPDGALHLLRNALLEQDTKGLIEQTSAKTRETLRKLHEKARQQYAQIKTAYPPEHAMGAWGAYPPGLLSAETPVELFKALAAQRLSGLERGPGLKYGMSASGSPVVLRDTANVATKSGESITFTLEDGVWRTTAFEVVLTRNLERMVLNEQTLAENLKALKTYTKSPADSKPAE